MAKSTPRRPPERKRFCSFCGKSNEEVLLLISGPKKLKICNECAELCNTIVKHELEGPKVPAPREIKHVPLPKEIKEGLDEYVIGQEKAKKVISVAVHNHYKRLTAVERGVEIEKSNVLLMGPTGCGKTLMARILAEMLEVPFAIGDATTLTEAGYVGEDVENLLLRLLQAADLDTGRAERGIIYIDEIDKIGRTWHNVSITRDVSGEGVQQSLLKMLEGTIANVPPQGGRKHPEQQYIQIDTTRILFICGGTFSGLEEITARRIGRQMIGFGSEPKKDNKQSLGELLAQVEPDDLIEYGLIPEFVGRLPVIVPLSPLGETELVQILCEPRNAIVKQYERFFEMENAKLRFTDEALKEISKKALARGTGARALRSIVEDLMLDIMFHLPSLKLGGEYVVTPEVVRGEESLLDQAPGKDEEKREIA